jgi:hypothetical protein
MIYNSYSYDRPSFCCFSTSEVWAVQIGCVSNPSSSMNDLRNGTLSFVTVHPSPEKTPYWSPLVSATSMLHVAKRMIRPQGLHAELSLGDRTYHLLKLCFTYNPPHFCPKHLIRFLAQHHIQPSLPCLFTFRPNHLPTMPRHRPSHISLHT